MRLMTMRGTAGQLAVNSILPEDMRDYARVLDAKGIDEVARTLAERHPDKYRDVMHKLSKLGGDTSYYEGNSFGLRHLTTSAVAKKHVGSVRKAIRQIAGMKGLTREQRQDLIYKAVGKISGSLGSDVMAEALENDNPIAVWANSGARGKMTELNQMIGAPLLVTDSRGKPVPIPVLKNYSDGVDAAELFATAPGVRHGYTQLKLGTPKSGYFGKQLANLAHKLLVSDEEPPEGVGYEVDTSDPDNEGAVLARDYGDYKRGAILSPRMLKKLRSQHEKILVHSPIASPALNGIPRVAVGLREKGVIPGKGENVGIPAAQAVSEPLSQAMISSKHLGGIVAAGGAKGTSVETQSAFTKFERMANIPKSYGEYAPTLEADGVVEKIYEAPQGGQYVTVAGKDYWVPRGQELKVKRGDMLEAGDVLSDGLPNMSMVARHKGIGEGRRKVVEYARDILKGGNVKHNRRNLEILARGMLNHVKITSTDQRLGYLPDDTVEYDKLAATYTPRPGSKLMDIGMAGGQYLEAPVMHYSIGTRITPNVAKHLKASGVAQVHAHKDVPEFEPDMQRAVDSLAADEDWMVNMAGFNLERNFQKGLQAGKGTRLGGPSYIPDMARGVDFQNFGK